jgi:hypothetical protein
LSPEYATRASTNRTCCQRRSHPLQCLAEPLKPAAPARVTAPQAQARRCSCHNDVADRSLGAQRGEIDQSLGEPAGAGAEQAPASGFVIGAADRWPERG